MERALVIVLAVWATVGTTEGVRNKQMTANVTQTLDFLLASNRYDKRLRPGFGGPPATISVNFFIKSMGPVSDNDQSFGLDCYFRQHWYDLRLRYQKFPGLEEFSMSWLFLDRVWKPDTYFVNGKRSYLHRITVPNKFLRLRHDGFITYSMRLTISAKCPMYLRKFPLDAQRCPLVLGSYGYTNKDLVYRWTDSSPIGLQPGMEIAQFDLVNVTTESEKSMMKGGWAHSTVQANFWLKRHTGYFMLQVYIPCGLIVVCSWISFWIDPDAVPARVYVPCGLIVLSSWVSFWIDPDDVAARVALGVTTVLSLTTMGFGGRAQLPKVSYWTALDWFVIICFTSVFSVMIEYAIVNFIDKFKKDLKKIIQRRREEEKEKEEEAKKKEGEEMQLKPEAKAKTPSALRTRSASFSFSVPEEGGECETVLQMEPKPRSLSTTVAAYFYFRARKSKSVPNIRPAAEEATRAKRTGRIDWAAEGEVVVDMREHEDEEEEQQKAEGKKRVFENFLKRVKRPKDLWSKMKIPERSELIRLVEGSEEQNKFSRIDVQSRRNFPIVFFLSLVVYLYAFSYYLTDDVPTSN